MSTIPKIQSIEQLVKNLTYGGGYDGYQGILEALDFDQSEIEKYTHWDKGHYSRVKLAEFDAVELYMLCWEKGQETPIYELGNVDVWIYVLEGELLDEMYTKPKKGETPERYQTTPISKGNYNNTSDSRGLHKLVNTNDGRTISLHLFMDKVEKWSVFDTKTKSMKPHSFKTHHSYDL